MKRTSWEWENSNKKRTIKIMWDTQGQDLETVAALIMEACNVDNVAARALYRKIARDELIAQGFVPAPAKLGRPRKDGSAPVARTVNANTGNVTVHAPVIVHHEPEEVVERTATGEKKSIADMKAYLETLKRKANG
mgnify:CR=1 FL=1